MSHLAKDMTPDVTWKDITPGCNIFEGGTSVTVETGDWRTMKPVIDWDKCKQCLLCAPVCPDIPSPWVPMASAAISTTSSARAAASARTPAPSTPSPWSRTRNKEGITMGIRERLSGNEAIAYAMKQINPDVMGAFPITPSTEIPQYFSTYVDNGEVDTEFIAVESEHSAMSTCIGAEAAGCRAISATSSCGLCYMTEMLYVAASDRLPITLAVSCRALSGPININNDHSDAMGVRDAGWLMLFAETNQEAYDNYLQAMRIAEAVSLPIMICQDGFITSHAKDVIKKVGAEFGEMTGRTYGLIEKYMMDDADVALIMIGSSAGTAKEAIQEMRAQGKKVGLIKIRSFRPFPAEEIAEALKNVKAFAAMDKDDSFNAHCGPIYAEVAAALYSAGISAPKGINFIYGLGGRDVRVESIERVVAELEKVIATGEVGETYRYLDVRE